MKKQLFGSLIALFVTAGCGDASTDDESLPAETVSSAPEGLTLLATLRLSPTHELTFYRETGGGLVKETLNVDLDKPVLRDEKLVHGHYLDVYLRFAGRNADSAAIERLRAFDEAALAEPVSDEPEESEADGEEVNEIVPPNYSVAQSRQKDAFSDFIADADRFRLNACGGCVGQEGSRQNFGEPSSWPTCLTVPEYCLFFGEGTALIRKRSKFFNVWIENFSHTESANFTISIHDPCEHSSTWERWTGQCGFASTRVWEQPLGPRTSSGLSATTSKSWTRNYQMVGPFNTAFKLDV